MTYNAIHKYFNGIINGYGFLFVFFYYFNFFRFLFTYLLLLFPGDIPYIDYIDLHQRSRKIS